MPKPFFPKPTENFAEKMKRFQSQNVKNSVLVPYGTSFITEQYAAFTNEHNV